MEDRMPKKAQSLFDAAGIKLKPCPFCGELPALESDKRYPRPAREPVKTFEVVCRTPGCIIYGLDDNYYFSPKTAAEAWNKRAEIQEETT